MDYIRKSEVLERIRCYPVASETELTPMTQGIWIAGVEEAREQIAEGISEIPAADVVKVVHGRWIRLDAHKGMEQFKCSICRSECYVPTCMNEPMYDYCPNCGAKMGLGGE